MLSVVSLFRTLFYNRQSSYLERWVLCLKIVNEATSFRIIYIVNERSAVWYLSIACFHSPEKSQLFFLHYRFISHSTAGLCHVYLYGFSFSTLGLYLRQIIWYHYYHTHRHIPPFLQPATRLLFLPVPLWSSIVLCVFDIWMNYTFFGM